MLMTVQIDKTARRELHFNSIEELTEEVKRIVEHDERGDAHTTGNWSVGQIFQHVGKVVACSFDGFPFTVPWHTRLFCKVVAWVSWRYLLRLAFRPGHKMPDESLRPDPGVTARDGAAYLLGQLERIQRGEKMRQPSPYEGPLTHEQSVEVHLRHAELHLGFIRYGEEHTGRHP